MGSTYSVRLRIDYQAPGDNLNTWGTRLNTAVFQLLEDAIARRVALTVSGPVSLTSNNGTTDQARCAFLDCTGTGGTITAPASEKIYLLRNGGSGSVIITTGGGRTATFLAGEVAFCVCDASNYDRLATQSFGAGPFTMAGALDMGAHKITSVTDPTNPQDAATKAYADALAFTANAGILPGQVGSAGKFLTTDGVTASWGYGVTVGAGLASITTNTLTVTGSTASQIRVGTSTSTAATPSALTGSAAFIPLTDASTVAWDVSTGYNATVTLGGNRVIGAPTNLQDGITYTLELVQDGTGTRIPTWNAIWDFGAAGTPVLQTATGKADKVYAQYNARTSKLEASFRKGA